MPPSSNSLWFYIRERKKVGPVRWEELRDLIATGQLNEEDMLLRQGAQKWAPARTIDGLFPTAIPFSNPPGDPSTGTLGPSLSLGQTRAFPGRSAAEPDLPLPEVPGYRVIGELGRGGMGVVYLAEQSKLKRMVALKMILAGGAASRQELERFRTEAEAIARLQHPNIVQVHEVGELDNQPYFSVEYCPGGSLAERLNGAPLPPREAAGLAECLARAVQAAHERGILHRDLKPANVLVGDKGTLKITDFGLAKKMDEADGLTQSGTIVGTPSYMPPEQALGKRQEVGPAADVYALGAILYEMLIGRPPFRGATAMDTILQVAHDEPVPPSRLLPRLPVDLETMCLRCLEKSPARRYPTAQALADDLRRFLNGEPVLARPAGRLERAWKWARRKPSQAALFAVSVLGLLTILIGSLYFTVQVRYQRNVALAEKSVADCERQRAQASEQEAQGLRKRAEDREAEAKQQLDQARRSLMTAQMWRVAGILDRAPVSALQVLHDRNACPLDLRDFTWNYYQTLCQQWKPALLSGHKGSIDWVAASPDGKTLASASADGTVRLWELETRKCVATLAVRTPVNQVDFSPDGNLVALAGQDGTVRLWEVAQAKELVSLQGHAGMVNGVSFSPDGKWLVSGSAVYVNSKDSDHHYQHGAVRLWNVAERKLER